MCHWIGLATFHYMISDGGRKSTLVQPDISSELNRAGGPTKSHDRSVRSLKANGFSNSCATGRCPPTGKTFHLLEETPEFGYSLNESALAPGAASCRPSAPTVMFLDIYDSADAPWLFKGEPLPADGKIILEETPGFGYSLNESALAPGAQVAPIW